MTRYALVRILDEKAPLWGVFRAAYELHYRSGNKESSLRNTVAPSIRSFEEFANRALGPGFIVSQVTEEIADGWIVDLRSRLKYSSVRTRLACMQAMFEWGRKTGKLSDNVFRRKLDKMPFSGRNLSDEEIAALLHSLPDAYRRMATIYLYTGMRARELDSMQWWQVYSDALFVPAEKNKSDRSRTIPFPKDPSDRDKLIAALGPRRGHYDYVAPVCYENFGACVRDRARSLGLGRIKVHDFRHTCITRFFENSDDVWLACDVFGWASPVQAKPYMHMTQKRRERFDVRYTFPTTPLRPGPRLAS